MHFIMSRTYLSCRTRSRTCHTDAQYGISPQIALILGPIQPSHHGIDAFKFSSYVKFILNQSRAYDRLDIANDSVNPQAVVGGLGVDAVVRNRARLLRSRPWTLRKAQSPEMILSMHS